MKKNVLKIVVLFVFAIAMFINVQKEDQGIEFTLLGTGIQALAYTEGSGSNIAPGYRYPQYRLYLNNHPYRLRTSCHKITYLFMDNECGVCTW